MDHTSTARGPEDDRIGLAELDHPTVAAVGKLSEALETVEVARGHLYAFHQLTGTADFAVEDAVELFRQAGHDELASLLARDLLGRNVLPGRWTYQVVEDYEETYYQVFHDLERRARELVQGRRHVHEAWLKSRRRTAGASGHESVPDELAASSAGPTALPTDDTSS